MLYPTYSDNFVSQDPEQEASSAAGARISPWHVCNLCPICRWFSILFATTYTPNTGNFQGQVWFKRGAFARKSWVCKKLASAQTLARGFRNGSTSPTVGKFTVLKMSKITVWVTWLVAIALFWSMFWSMMGPLLQAEVLFQVLPHGRTEMSWNLPFGSILCPSCPKISRLKRWKKKRMAIKPGSEKMDKRKLVEQHCFFVVVGHFEHRKARLNPPT